MREVIVRDAQRGDASAIAQVSCAAVPYLVRSATRVGAELKTDGSLGRRRWVGLLDGEVAGTAVGQEIGERGGEREVYVGVEVHPERGSRGVGTALLLAAVGAFPATRWLRSVGRDDPISKAFAVRLGFVPESEQAVSRIEPAQAPAPGPAPAGLRAITLEALPDLRMLLATHNAAVFDDPSGRTTRYTMYQLRSEWWDSPDNAPELSFGLLDDRPMTPVLAGFTSVQVDRDLGRAWSTVTVTHPAYRGRGVARWLKARMLTALAEVGVRDAWAAHDPVNVPMLSVNTVLGYRTVAGSVGLARRLPR